MEKNNNSNRIAVIGAGINGLLCATMLQERVPGAQIVIFADKFLKETTSDGAAGIFRPGVTFSGPTKEITEKWLMDSYNFYNDFINESTRDSKEVGIYRLRLYLLSSKSPDIVQNHFLEKILPDYRDCTAEELNFYGEDLKYGTTCTSIITECRKYMPHLTEKFQSGGGKIVKRKLDSFGELANDFNLIINCSALGSKELCQDRSMNAIRGQIYKVHAPWLKNAIYKDFDTYIIPGTELVTMGGTRDFSNFDVTINKYNSEEIWEKCTTLLPRLKTAKIEREWVGLRPYRSQVRVERETLKVSKHRSIEVVHNYGHGGFGVMTAPGTSMNAVDLALQYLKQEKNLHSKL